jgi:hypothetical protein
MTAANPERRARVWATQLFHRPAAPPEKQLARQIAIDGAQYVFARYAETATGTDSALVRAQYQDHDRKG